MMGSMSLSSRKSSMSFRSCVRRECMPPVARVETTGLFPHRVLFREHPSLLVDQWNRPSWRAKMNAHPATFNAERRIQRKDLDTIFQPQICLTSTAALGDSIHQRSRRNCDGGADNRWHTVFTVGERNADHAH